MFTFNAKILTEKATQMGVPPEHVGVFRTYLQQTLNELTSDEQLAFIGKEVEAISDEVTNNDLVPNLTGEE